ncbi:DUF1592 domain-containing protein [Polyangium aurulentum]|uniref:DUF1592 domain-containing protein n=1 Tax=Polyangium aurulentum TaxID=2567896 RepID=UPI0010ADCB36|nr:DUF1592 domain-containing protein [Polyangium aurulentum]UQA56077.1 DUF1592 domain-containing protein [Polyangium aurulentum]
MRRLLLGNVLMISALVAGCSGDDAGPTLDPGRVTMHRLNRVEYNNTVRDLLGTQQRPADDFPTDNSDFGYDNIADSLSMSTIQLELYERAAESLAEEAMKISVPSTETKFEAEKLPATNGGPHGDAWNLWSNGTVTATMNVATAGEYLISIRAWENHAGAEYSKLELSIDGKVVKVFDIKAVSATPEVVTATVQLTAGNRKVEVAFLNDYYDEAASQDRNLYVDWIKVTGPQNAVVSNGIRDKIVTCDPASGEACLRKILADFGQRAWRRPLTEAEVTDLLGLIDKVKAEGDSVDKGIEVALRALLLSPHFIFRPEVEVGSGSAAPHALNGYEIASRLSYFLWSSMPDDELFTAAANGSLNDPAGIRAQVDRMLDDPKAQSLIENFAGQWLHTRALDSHQPDYVLFPEFDEKLRVAMRIESELFFKEFLTTDLPMNDMLTADFTFVNDRLAEYYGVALPGTGDEFVRVQLDAPDRRGLFTQSGILTVTSYPRRTSPVKRGKWALTQILCDSPPPPPPGVEGLKDIDPTASLRERLEMHRKNEPCKSCHATMDQIGFGMEQFDAIGQPRTEDQGFPIDATGTLPTGESFNGAVEMGQVLHDDTRFGRCVTTHLLTYALGRGMSPSDDPYLDQISAEFQGGGYKLKELIAIIATSEPFRTRRGESGGAK